MPYWGDTPPNTPSAGLSVILPTFPNEIIPRLYISNIVTAEAVIKGTLNLPSRPVFTHIISMYSGKKENQERLRPSQDCTLKCKQILVDDYPNVDIIEWFPEICRFIHEALKSPTSNVLVHCFAGRSRSVTAIAAYLIWSLHFSRIDALTYIASKRERAMPNEGFNLQLELWQSLDCNLLNMELTDSSAYVDNDAYAVAKGDEGWKSDTRSGAADIGALLNIERPRVR